MKLHCCFVARKQKEKYEINLFKNKKKVVKSTKTTVDERAGKGFCKTKKTAIWLLTRELRPNKNMLIFYSWAEKSFSQNRVPFSTFLFHFNKASHFLLINHCYHHVAAFVNLSRFMGLRFLWVINSFRLIR